MYQLQRMWPTYLMYSDMFWRMSPYILNTFNGYFYMGQNFRQLQMPSVLQKSWLLPTSLLRSRGERSSDEKASHSPDLHLWAEDLVCQQIKRVQALIKRGLKVAQLQFQYFSNPSTRSLCWCHVNWTSVKHSATKADDFLEFLTKRWHSKEYIQFFER